MGKDQFGRPATKAQRHDPLHVQLMGPSENDPLPQGKQPRAKAARNERKNKPDAVRYNAIFRYFYCLRTAHIPT